MTNPRKLAKQRFGANGIKMMNEVHTWLVKGSLSRINPANENLLNAAAQNTHYQGVPTKIDQVVTLAELGSISHDRLMGAFHKQMRAGASRPMKHVSQSIVDDFEKIFETSFLLFASIDDKLCTNYLRSVGKQNGELSRDVLDKLVNNFRQLYRTVAWMIATGKKPEDDEMIHLAFQYQLMGFPLWSANRLSPPTYTVIVSQIPPHLKLKKRD